MFIVAQHKMIFEKELKEEDYKHSPDLYQKIVNERNNAQKIANDIISSIKSFETFENSNSDL
jgi:hypothetical protein